MGFNPLNTAAGALYLAVYAMEAVGFTEFIYEEATQQGLNVLKQMRKKKEGRELEYMARKFRKNVLERGYYFHLQFGTINPYTYPGFDAFWKKSWKKYDSIVYLREDEEE